MILGGEKIMNNTLLIGNGLNQALYTGAKKWDEILSADNDLRQCIDNYTFLYEANLLRMVKRDNSYDDDRYKNEIISRLKPCLNDTNIKTGVESIDKLFQFAKKKNVDNILTTNYDQVIETGLSKFGYNHKNIDDSETIYSMRRKREYSKNDHELCLWKIHGDSEHIKSICLGYDQYCGYLSKIQGYIKGNYSSSKNEAYKVDVKIEEKIKNDKYDHISWVELLFSSNVYMFGFSLDYSEIDLWWLLQRRARMMGQGVKILNKIVFLYNEYDYASDEVINNASDLNEKNSMMRKNKKLEDKIKLLNELGVECRRIEIKNALFSSVFSQIK